MYHSVRSCNGEEVVPDREESRQIMRGLIARGDLEAPMHEHNIRLSESGRLVGREMVRSCQSAEVNSRHPQRSDFPKIAIHPDLTMGDFESGTSALGKRRMFNLLKRNSEAFSCCRNECEGNFQGSSHRAGGGGRSIGVKGLASPNGEEFTTIRE